ncbi:hypothetical protein CEXT_512421, partial [Caerostris extrusa]
NRWWIESKVPVSETMPQDFHLRKERNSLSLPLTLSWWKIDHNAPTPLMEVHKMGDYRRGLSHRRLVLEMFWDKKQETELKAWS